MPITAITNTAVKLAVILVNAVILIVAIIAVVIVVCVWPRKTEPDDENTWYDADWWPVDTRPNKFKAAFRKLFYKVIREPKCDGCPCAWEEWSYEGDGDCGCVLHKNNDMPESGFLCHLPNPVKRFLRKRIDAHIDKLHAHDYDDIIEWFEKDQKKDSAMLELLRAKFPDVNFDISIAAALRADYEDAARNIDKEAQKTA